MHTLQFGTIIDFRWRFVSIANKPQARSNRAKKIANRNIIHIRVSWRCSNHYRFVEYPRVYIICRIIRVRVYIYIYECIYICFIDGQVLCFCYFCEADISCWCGWLFFVVTGTLTSTDRCVILYGMVFSCWVLLSCCVINGPISWLIRSLCWAGYQS